jgi:hypothetical protein
MVRVVHTVIVWVDIVLDEVQSPDHLWTNDNNIKGLSFEFIPLSFWYDAPLTSQYRDRRHDPWLV